MMSLSAFKSGITHLRFSGIKLLVKNQKKTGNAIQYVKRTTFTTTIRNNFRLSGTFNNNFNNFSISQKLLINQCRPFHATQPTSVPVPAFLLVFKTANAALAIRYFSNLFLSLLPFALRKNPKTGKQRRTLLYLTTGIPLIGFSILILAGLEETPHTGRLRFNLMSEEEERELCNLSFSHIAVKYQNNFLPLNRVESKFVSHVASNLVKGLNNDLMTLKSFKKLNDKESSEEVANIMGKDVDNTNDKSINTQVEKGTRPFEVYVIENDRVLNALSFGASKKIIIFTGWLKLINYDEEYLAVTLSHEIAHIIQGHASESFGFSQMLYLLTDTARTLLWPLLAIFGPLLNDYLNSMTQVLVEEYSSGKHNQRAEKEADIVGLQLMALSGYHPKKAVELWKYLSSLNNQDKTKLEDTLFEEITEVKTEEQLFVLQSLQDFFASHPLEEVRANYLSDVLPEVEEIYEKTVTDTGRATVFNSISNNHVNNEPVKANKDAEDWVTSKIWNNLRYFMGLNSES